MNPKPTQQKPHLPNNFLLLLQFFTTQFLIFYVLEWKVFMTAVAEIWNRLTGERVGSSWQYLKGGLENGNWPLGIFLGIWYYSVMEDGAAIWIYRTYHW